jgi:cellulose synthase/poly-beta-1,6-N-acetylglucosamine synthase-like glycosyltransferase
VVPFLNTMEYLDRSVGSVLAALERSGGELILIDNGSSDGSFEYAAERWGSQAQIHRMPGATIGQMRNHGAHLAKARTLSFVDSDCVVPPDYYEEALRVLDETGASATGSRYALPDDPHWIEVAWHELHERSVEGPVNYLNAGNFLCRRRAFQAVGGFDETLITGEDTELCQRLRAAGSVVYEAPTVVAQHLGNPKTLRAFFRKQRWHGLGMFGTMKNRWFDQPVIMTFAHLSAMVTAVLLLTATTQPWWVRTLGVPAFFAVPALTVSRRAWQRGRVSAVWRGMLLYHLYFDARVSALGAIIMKKLTSRSGLFT